MPALQTLLSPQVLTKVVSQKAAASDWILKLFQLGPGQKNEVYEGHGRYGAFNIYNNVRTVAKGRAPGTAAARSRPNPLGVTPFTYPRMHDSVSLPAEVMHNLGLLSDPAQRDAMGADMIRRQTETLAQKAANWRKAQMIGCLRDSLYLKPDGDNQYITFTSSGAMQIPFRMPAGNKAQLNMLGAGAIIDASWATATTNIPKHLLAINAAFQRLNGGHLCSVICGFQVFDWIRKNDHVQEEHGAVRTPYLRFERLEYETELGKTSKNVMVVELTCAPGVLFYITDEGLDLGAEGSETFTKIVGDNEAIFIGFEPGDDVIQCYQGSEPISEYDAGPKTQKIGMASWAVERSNPTATDLFVLDNSLVVNHVPDSVAYATVAGF
jgi:hypothetical protein